MRHTLSQVYVLKSVACISRRKGKFVPVLNEPQRHEGVLGEWRYSYITFLIWM